MHRRPRRGAALWLTIVMLVLVLAAPAGAEASFTASPAATVAAEDTGDQDDWPAYAYVIVAVGGTLLIAFGFALNARDRRRDAEDPDGS